MRWPDIADALESIDIGTVVAWVVIIGAVAAGVRKAWPGLKALVKFADMVKKLDEMMPQLTATKDWRDETTGMLSRLRRQVENSHRTNLRDELTEALELAKKTAASVEGLHGRIDKLETNDADQARILTDVQGKLGRDHKRLNVIEETMPRDELGRFTKKKEEEDDRSE